MSTNDRIVELLNTASVAIDAQQKLDALKIVQELLVRKEPNLLDNFLDEVMGFQKDRSQEVRKFVVGFIEEACKNVPDTLPNVIANLRMLMTDSAVAVQKRVIQAMTSLYKVTLAWISKAKTVTEDMEAVWNVVSGIKDIVTHLLEAENDGIRTHTVKFMEMLVITQTHKKPESIINKTNEFTLEDVPLTLKIARRRKLENEADEVFEELIKYHESAHISSANLMTCMGALTNIAKCRPQFMARVITALEMLQANLPPTLAKSQVSSVRKHLKNQLLALLKHPIASDPEQKYFTNITTLLTDLGATRDEVMKAMPKFEEVKKKVRKAAEMASTSGESAAKKPKLDPTFEDDVSEASDDDEEEEVDPTKKKMIDSAVDITEKFILERLTPSIAAEIVMKSMAFLPREIPPQFHNTYTPIAAAGTEGQVKHVSRLLATQLTSAKLGPGIEEVEKSKAESKDAMEGIEDEDAGEDSKSTQISTVVSGKISSINMEKEKKSKITLRPAGLNSGHKRIKTMRLADITKPMTGHENMGALNGAFQRILYAQHLPNNLQVQRARNKILTSQAAHFSPEMKNIFIRYLLDDIQSHSNLALTWLYEEYCFYMGFNKVATLSGKRSDDKEYNNILCSIIRGVMDRNDVREREQLMRQFYLKVPIITEDAIQLLKQFIQIEGSAISVVMLIKDLVTYRPMKKLNFLNFLLEFCSHEIVDVRDNAIETILHLHSNGDFNEIIEDYSVMYLRFLLSPNPPPMLFGEDRGRPVIMPKWTDDIIKVCLYLYLSLLPQNLKLFPHLAEVYVSTGSDVKRTILRVLDFTVRNIDMNDPNFLKIFDEIPKGGETLITRIIHILADKSKPTTELVNKVRELYEERGSDVRILIPILSGLSKQEVITALPKFIGLAPAKVKEVFNRIVTLSPLNASDLLISLHNIERSQDEMMVLMKAMNVCFQDKATFNQDVMTIVLQQLLEQPQIPLFFMRTVIHSVNTFPSMIGFVINILQRLIVKQVWKQPKVWQGFIRCCELIVPQSYAVMLQLPPAQLKLLLDASPKTREPLLEHVQGFTESQRAHVPANIMEVLYDADVQRIKHTDDETTEGTSRIAKPELDVMESSTTPPPGAD